MSNRYFSNRLHMGKGRYRKFRPPTFTTEDSAKAYAEKEGIKEFEIENLRSPESKQPPKFRLVSK